MTLHAYKHLKPEQHYIDLYDRQTVERCREKESAWKKLKDPNKKGDAAKLEAAYLKCFSEVGIHCFQGECFANKEKTIREWMNRDREADEKLERAETPNVFCLQCGEPMECFTKDFQDKWDKRPGLVLFHFRCEDCKAGRAFYDDGMEKDLNHYCKKCSGLMEINSTRKGNIITTIEICTKCRHKEKHVLNLSEDKAGKEKVLSPKEIKRFESDKARFCMSEKEGVDYIDSIIKLQNFNKVREETAEKEKNKKLYDQLEKLKKLNIVDLEKLLSASIEKSNHHKLELAKPEIAKYVITEFTVRDSESGRHEYDSRSQLKKVIEKALLDTNWVLMSEGINYRMGFLSGKLKGIEDEKELIKLIENRHNKARTAKKKSSDKTLL